MSATLLESIEGLDDSPVKHGAGEVWNLLQAEKENVYRHLTDSGPLCRCSPVNVVESEPAEESERQIEWRHRSDLENQLREIVDAQDRLIDGRYGLCTSCGREIDVRRLLVEPTASMCVVCKRSAESEMQRCTL